MKFPLWGSYWGLDPQDVPRSEFLMVHSIQLVETEIVRCLSSWCVAYCIFVMLHIAGIRLYWEVPFPGQILLSFWGLLWWGSGMSTRPSKGIFLRQNTHSKPLCSFLRFSVRVGREPEKPGEKKSKLVTQQTKVTNVPLEAGLTYRHETSSEC
jgi:hypothetical protein